MTGSEDITPEELAAIEARLHGARWSDSDFINGLKTDVPRLIAALRKAWEQKEEAFRDIDDLQQRLDQYK